MTVAHRRRFFSSSSGSGPGVKLFIRSGQEDIRYLRALVPLHPHPLPTHSSGFGHGGSGYWHADRDKNLVQLLYDSGSSSSSSLSSSSMYLSSSMSFLSLLWFSCIFRHSPTFHVVSKIYDVFGTQFHQGGEGYGGQCPLVSQGRSGFHSSIVLQRIRLSQVVRAAVDLQVIEKMLLSVNLRTLTKSWPPFQVHLIFWYSSNCILIPPRQRNQMRKRTIELWKPRRINSW